MPDKDKPKTIKLSPEESAALLKQMQAADKSFSKAIELEACSVEHSGNADAKILAKAYQEFAADGLSQNEEKKIEEIDTLLPNADIVISKTGNSATIAQENGKTFSVKPKGRSR